MLISELKNFINSHFPADSAMEGDRIGLQIQSARTYVNKLLFTMEVNDEVIEEAKEQHIDCIVSFHPLIYAPLTEIHENERVGRLTSELIRNDIALYVLHTSFDAFEHGTSRILADKLDLKTESFLVNDPKISNCGMGVIAKPNHAMTHHDLLKRISEICYSPIRYSKSEEQKRINSIAIVGGSGGSFVGDALRSKVDAFITADLSYHVFHRVSGDLMLFDPGHYEMEQFVGEAMAEFFKRKLPKNSYDSIHISKVHTNPVSYYPDAELYTENQRKYLFI